MTKATYTVDEIAELLGISRSCAYQAVHQGNIPSIRIGRRILIPHASLQKLLSIVEEQAPGKEIKPAVN